MKAHNELRRRSTARSCAAATRCSRPHDRHHDPRRLRHVTDGPFAETKEALGGYYLIEAADLDEAHRDRQAGARRRSAASRSARSWSSTEPLGRPAAVAAAVADAHRREWAFVLAATVRVTRDLDLAEECVQDAYAPALDAWADARRPGAARRLADDVGPAPGARRAAPARRRCAARCRCSSSDDVDAGPPTTTPTTIPDDRLRLVFTCCHPALAAGGAGRADPAAGVRADDGRGRARVPGQRADDGRADHPGEEEDRRRPHPVPRAAARRAARAARRGARRRAPALHHRPHRAGRRRPGPPRPGRAGARPGPDAARAAAGRRRRRRAARADAADRRPPRDPGRRGRPAAAARRAGPHRGGTARAIARGRRRWCARRCGAGRRAGSRCRRRSPPCTPRRRRWEDTDWREIVGALRRARCSCWPSPVVALNRAVAVGFADGPGGRPGGARRAGRRAAARRLRLPARPRAPTSCAGSAGSTRRATAYEEALLLTENAVERDFLAGRLRRTQATVRRTGMDSQARRVLLWCRAVGPGELDRLDPAGQRGEQRLGLEAGDVLPDALVDAHAEPDVPGRVAGRGRRRRGRGARARPSAGGRGSRRRGTSGSSCRPGPRGRRPGRRWWPCGRTSAPATPSAPPRRTRPAPATARRAAAATGRGGWRTRTAPPRGRGRWCRRPRVSSERTISGACSAVMSPRSAAAQICAPNPSVGEHVAGALRVDPGGQLGDARGALRRPGRCAGRTR